MKTELELAKKEGSKLTEQELQKVQKQQQEESLSDLCEAKFAERAGLTQVYKGIISKERTPETAIEARDCRLKLLKVRTGIKNIGETERAYSVAYQKMVIKWVEKEILPVSQMEEELMEIEKYQEKLDQKIKDELRDTRTNELLQFNIESIPSGLGDMDQSVYDIFLSGIKATNEAKKEAERKAEEERVAQEEKEKLYTTRKTELFKYKAFCNITLLELDTLEMDYWTILDNAKEAKKEHDEQQKLIKHKQDLYTQRKELMLPLSQFCMIDQLTLDMTNEEWDKFSSDAEAKKADHDQKQEEIRLENERLKKEREELEAKVIEDKKIRKSKAIQFLESCGFKSNEHGMNATKYPHFIGENHYSDISTDNELSLFEKDVLKTKAIEEQKLQHLKEDEERKKKEEEAQRIRDKELEQERAEKVRLSKELQDKKDEEAKAEKERVEAERAKELAPDKTKLMTEIDEMNFDIPELKSADSKEVADDIRIKFQGFKTWAIMEVNKLK